MSVDFYALRSTRHHAARAFPLVAEWLDHLAYRDLAETTRDDYERTVAEFVLWRDRELAAYGVNDIETWLASKSAASRNKRKAALQSLFSWARRREHIPENPVDLLDPITRPRQKVVDIFTDGEVEILCGLPSPDGPLLTLLLFTGIRKSEARRLQRSAIVLDPVDDEGRIRSGHLVVYKGKGNKDRVVPFSGRAAAAVSELDLLERLNPTDYLWPTKPGGGNVISRERPVSDTTFQRWWAGDPKPMANPQKGVLQRAGIPYRKLHTTRHTYATRLIRRGARIENVQKLMGHSSIQTTIDEYGHLTVEDARADLALLEAEV